MGPERVFHMLAVLGGGLGGDGRDLQGGCGPRAQLPRAGRPPRAPVLHTLSLAEAQLAPWPGGNKPRGLISCPVPRSLPARRVWSPSPGDGLPGEEQGGKEGGSHTRVRTAFIFRRSRGCEGPAGGSHLGLREHLPALQLAHFDQGGREAHVGAGGDSDPVAVSCEGGGRCQGSGAGL